MSWSVEQREYMRLPIRLEVQVSDGQRTLILSSHQLERVLSTFPRVIGLRRGRILFDRTGEEPSLSELIARLSPCDLVLVEGFKRDPIPKLEVHREAARTELIHPHDPHVIAIATDVKTQFPIPSFPLDDLERITKLILASATPVAWKPTLVKWPGALKVGHS